MSKALVLTKDLFHKHFFGNVPVLIDDCQPIRCLFCGKEAWLPDDVKHKRKCACGIALTEINKELARELTGPGLRNLPSRRRKKV